MWFSFFPPIEACRDYRFRYVGEISHSLLD
jgi:hypothetical protein